MTNVLGMAWRKLLREWRSGELLVLFIALLVAVAAMTAVSFFTDRVARVVAMQAAEVLAADLVLSSGRQLDPGVVRQAEQAGLQTARRVSFPSVVLSGDQSALADIEAVSENYPLRGRLRIADSLLAEVRTVDRVPAPGEAWAEARLLAQMGIDVGARLEVGAHQVAITQVLDFAPDRGWRFADLAPGLMINIADIDKTQLIQPGSRVSWSALFAGAPGLVTQFRRQLDEQVADHERLRDLSDLQPEMRSAVDRAGRFLSLAALVAALLAAVALSMAARRYASHQLDQVALLKCLGASQARITAGIALELMLLALIGGLVGSALGWVAQQGLSLLTSDLVGAVLPPASLRSVVLGLLIAVVLLAGFALPPLLALRKVPPVRVLHRDLPPARVSRAASYLAAASAIAVILVWLVRDVALVAWLGLGAVVSVAVLYAVGWLFVLSARRLRGVGGFSWRYGLANIARRGSDSVIQVIGFGMGLMALLLLTVVRNDLLQSWRDTLPADAPNYFMINIDPAEAQQVGDFLLRTTGQAPQLAPLVRARLVAINSQPIGEMTFPSPRGRRFAERESNLSWTQQLAADNRIVDGRWWGQDPQAGGEVSVEVDFASSLGLGIGDRLRFDVAGEIVEAPVTSLRSVEWDSFQPNFFMLLSPNVLGEYPATFIGAIHVPGESRNAMIELVRQYPTVTTIDMNAVLSQVRSVMDKAALAVQYVFVFTLIAGVTVLLAAVQTTLEERHYESALLRTFGASRRLITRGVATEFTMLGLLAGLLAAVGAGLAAWLVAVNIFELAYRPQLSLWLLGPAAGALLVGVSGSLATRRVANTSPIMTLRR